MLDKDFPRRRKKLVEHLRKNGIEDKNVLNAFSKVRRHQFIETAFWDRAYSDIALPIGMKQTISQPSTVAIQTQMMEVVAGDKVLEIGTGSGFQAAILCEMGIDVYSIERHGALLRHSAKILRQLGYRLKTKESDGTMGWPAFAPYDGIVVTAGALDVPESLLDDLRQPSEEKRGGRLVIPIGDTDSQKMYIYERLGKDDFRKTEAGDFKFVPLIGAQGGH